LSDFAFSHSQDPERTSQDDAPFSTVPHRRKNFIEPSVWYRTDGYRSRIIIFADDRLMLGERAMRKPDPELLPIQRPRCPTCQARMLALGVEDAPDGFESRIFRCGRCHRTETRLLAADPMKTGAVGWLSGELGRPE
jgi:hypothetical protein